MLLPFNNAVVPIVDLEGGPVVIELPGEIEGDRPGSLNRYANHHRIVMPELIPSNPRCLFRRKTWIRRVRPSQ